MVVTKRAQSGYVQWCYCRLSLANHRSQWLQSGRQDELFEKYFVRYSPEYLGQVSQLVALTVAAAITGLMDDFLAERLSWLEVILHNMDVLVSVFVVSRVVINADVKMQDPTIYELAPRILDVITHRLSDTFMQLSETNPMDPMLAKIPVLVRHTKEIKALTNM